MYHMFILGVNPVGKPIQSGLWRVGSTLLERKQPPSKKLKKLLPPPPHQKFETLLTLFNPKANIPRLTRGWGPGEG